MEKKRIFIVLALSFLSVIGLALQALKPNWCTGTSYIMYITGGNQLESLRSAYQASRITAAIVVGICIIGMLIFALSVYRGNLKGRLKIAYVILLIHTVIMIIASIAVQSLWAFNNEDSKINVSVYFISMLTAGVTLAIFVLREHGGIRLIPNFSAVMLLVAFGQFVSNGLFVDSISKAKGLLYGVISALPYFTIFVFEKFVLEDTVKRYR